MTDNRNSNQKAVALTYDAKENSAPIVAAKAQGFLAEQMISIAKKHNIEIHQDQNLVEILSTLEVNTVIPVEAYAAVAEILSYLYQHNHDLKEKFSK